MEEIPEAEKVELFVDLNCPFCFCQVERVMRLRLFGRVLWKGIEHEPSLPLIAELDHPLAKSIREELRLLQEREPDFAVIDPGVRPNVRLALDALTFIQEVEPTLFWPMLQKFYRALWRDGLDISRADVVFALAERNGLKLSVTEEQMKRRSSYTEAWLKGPFEERLPAARSHHGAVLLGLNEEKRFELFLNSGLFSKRDGRSC